MAKHSCSCGEQGCGKCAIQPWIPRDRDFNSQGMLWWLRNFAALWDFVVVFLGKAHKFSPPVANKSACVGDTGQEVLVSAPGAQRCRRHLRLCCSCRGARASEPVPYLVVTCLQKARYSLGQPTGKPPSVCLCELVSFHSCLSILQSCSLMDSRWLSVCVEHISFNYFGFHINKLIIFV